MRQKASKKLMNVALLALLILSLITACSNSNTADSGSNQNEETGNADSSGSDEVITLRMIESLTSPKRTELLNAMIKQFQDENPNIKVELISPPFDQADNKIRTMLGAKQELDIVEARDLNVAEFVNNGYLEPLTDYTADWSDFATMTSAAKSTATVGDTLYFIPNGLYQRQMFYRSDWLSEKGIDVPANYEQLVNASIALTDPASNRYGFSFRGGPGANGVPDTMIQAYNAEKVDLNDAMFLQDGGTIYSSPEAKAAVDLYLKLYKEGSPPDSVNWGFQEQVQAFTSGVTAFLLQDPDVIQVLQENMDEGTWSTAPMPTGPSGKALISAGGAGWGITSYSKHKDAAWKLIAFLSSPAQNTEFSKDYGTVPIHSSAAEDEFFKTGPYKTLLDMTNMPETYLNFKPPFEYPANGQWGQVAMETGQAMLLGQATVEDTLKKWDDYWNKAKEELNK